MGATTQYAVQVALLLCALFLLYKWGLAGCTFCRFNRWVLISLYLLALSAIPIYSFLTGKVTDDTFELTLEQINSEIATLSDTPPPTWPLVIGVIYLAGVLVAVALTLRSACRIWQIIKCGSKERRHGCTLVFTPASDISPFSWGKYIVVPALIRKEDLEMVVAHERAHLRHRHWLDLALGQAIIIINWFNPSAYLMMKELQDVHEFEADHDVIKSGVDMRAYSMLLIRNASGSMFPLMADSLNHSRLMTRLRHMTRPRSNPFRKWAAAVTVPLIMAVTMAFDTPVMASRLSAISGATLFPSDYDEVEYIVDGNIHTIRYSQDDIPTSISMDLPYGTIPAIYINGHLASIDELRRIKSNDVVFLMGDNLKNRFVLRTH